LLNNFFFVDQLRLAQGTVGVSIFALSALALNCHVDPTSRSTSDLCRANDIRSTTRCTGASSDGTATNCFTKHA